VILPLIGNFSEVMGGKEECALTIWEMRRERE
jgi:hypothetical protein